MKNKIKVLQIVGEPVGGIRKHVHSILFNLDKTQFDQFYTYSINDKDISFKKDMKILSNIIVDNLEINVVKKPQITDIKNIIKIIKFIKKYNIDIVHGHGAKGGMYARIATLFTNVKSVYTPHGGVLHNAFNRLLTYLYISVEKLLKYLTDIVVVESNYSKIKYIEKIGDIGSRLILNYNGISINQEENVLIPDVLFLKKAEYINLAIFARLHKMKGQDIAIKSLEYLPSNYILHLFGNGEEMNPLHQLVKELDLQSRVYFHGDTNNTELIMNYIDIVLIPSTFESFSYVAAEALMMKRLVIANSVGGLKEVLAQESGILIENMDEFKLSKCLLNLNNKYKDLLIENGYNRYLQFFQENKMISNLESIYKSLED